MKYAVKCYNSDYCCRLNVCLVYNYFYGRQLLFPQPHKEQDGRARSARHGSLGNKKGNQENLQADWFQTRWMAYKSQQQTNWARNSCRLQEQQKRNNSNGWYRRCPRSDDWCSGRRQDCILALSVYWIRLCIGYVIFMQRHKGWHCSQLRNDCRKVLRLQNFCNRFA